MTPTNPITEVREGEIGNLLIALLDYTKTFYGIAIERGLPAIQAADYVQHVERAARRLHSITETQAAEIERLDKVIQSNHALYEERATDGGALIDSLKAKLAKAEEVIAPFEKIGTELCANPDAAGYVTIKTQASYFRAASQFTKGEEG